MSSPLMSQGSTGLQANTYPPIKHNKLITKEVPVNKNTLKNAMTTAHSLKMKADEKIDNSHHDLDKNVESIHN
jgi:hypothetical protein